MEKTFYFMCGLPRAGSTLLSNILNQNPEIYASQTSAMLEVMFSVRNSWESYIEHRAMDQDLSLKRKNEVIKGIMQSYYIDVDKPIIVDKSRGWLAHMELAEWVLDKKIKVIVPVRDIRDVLASFELLWRNTSKNNQMAQEKENYMLMQTVAGRCKVWMKGDQPVGLAYRRIKDALHRGYGDRMHFVHFDQLTSNPKETMEAIYDFLHIKSFKHDFNNVEQTTYENDFIHGIPDLHKIRPKVEYIAPRWPEVLGEEVAERYKGLNIY